MEELDNKTSLFEEISKFQKDRPRPKSYLEDVSTIIGWLTSKKENDPESNSNDHEIVLPYDPYNPQYRSGSVIDNALCFLHSISGLFLSLRECLITFGRF